MTFFERLLRSSESSSVRLAFLFAALFPQPPFTTAEPIHSVEHLASLDLEELLEIKIFSISKASETLWQSAAAAGAISSDDIRRAGVTSLPEALRLAPGINVARINSQRYAISIRGFDSEFADKLLVLQDGRSLYTPQFSGTFWDVQDTLLDDVERIEVIRGPGCAAWGINAVNGIVNIITKDARDTQGSRVVAGAGGSERGYGSLRHGGAIGEDTHYRIYAKAFAREESELDDGEGADDDWEQARAGFRFDSRPTSDDHLTLQGEVYSAELLQFSGGSPDDFDAKGAHVIAKWSHALSDRSGLDLQLYYDGTRRDSAPATADTDTADLEARHRMALGSWNELLWGLNYRVSANEAQGRAGHNYEPTDRTLEYYSLFAEDRLELVPKELRLTIGSKLEHHDFTGWEVMPNTRLAYLPSEDQTLWTAVSRGVRAPSIAENDLTVEVPAGPLTILAPPNRGKRAEELLAIETGFRQRLGEAATLDIALFYNDYDSLSSTEIAAAADPSILTIEQVSRRQGESYGGEVAAQWQASERLRWRLSYSLLETHVRVPDDSTDTSNSRTEGRSPEQQIQLWPSLNLASNCDLDLIFRFVDRLPDIPIDHYVNLDLRLGYRPLDELELSLVGQNLLDERHPEFARSPGFPANAEIRRGVLGQVKWEF